jgi:NitT/TauT family transport system substrate-binding protein
MHFTKKILAASAVAVAAAGFASAPAHAAEKVNYLLPAPGFLPAFAPWQLAKHKGYYAAEGLEVVFQRSKGGVDVAKQVGVGNAPIGGGIGDTSILVRPNGIPVRSVAVLGGGSLVQLVARADRGITKVEDLKGKTITVMSYQDTTFFASQGILASRGLTRNDANIQAAGPQGIWKLFIEGKADAMMGVPDWKDIMDNPDAAAADYVKAVPRWKAPAMAATFKLFNQYTYPGQKTLGAMDEARLAKLQDFYHEAGFIKKKSPVKDLYTNQFVN